MMPSREICIADFSVRRFWRKKVLNICRCGILVVSGMGIGKLSRQPRRPMPNIAHAGAKLRGGGG